MMMNRFRFQRKRLTSTAQLALYAGLLGLLLAACGSTSTPGSPTSAPTLAPTATTAGSSASTLNPARLPLGDGKLSTSPKPGYLYSCQTRFPGGGGAFKDGPWIHSDGTWDATTKIAVQGSITWPQASYTAALSGASRTLTTNDLPMNFPTGTFPIASSDPAAQYDRNPNHIAAQSLRYTLPAQPTAAQSATCLSGGVIGVLSDGVVLFDALDGEGRDAVAHELQDQCNGHPDQSSTYHYHDISSCLLKQATGSSTLVGYALDGFGIYVERDAQGNLLTDASLDACHGRTSLVQWDGKQVMMYHYDATLEFPYTLGCYMGTPVASHTGPNAGA